MTDLSRTSTLILELIAQGMTYAEIITTHPTLTLADITAAAREALDIIAAADDHTAQYPRAYEPWAPDEDAMLIRLFAAQLMVDEIAHRMQRQPNAIKRRLEQLGLLER